MGLLVEGNWTDTWYQTHKTAGRFIRSESQFRNWVTADGSPGPSGCGGYRAEPGRYHLYVSLACPWAHRAMIVRQLKSLGEVITVSVVESYMGENGWTFGDEDGATKDHVLDVKHLYEIYTSCVPDYSGRVTVPVLFDKRSRTIVSNESSEIIRMLNDPMGDLSGSKFDLYPVALRRAIDEINDVIYPAVNNGVYRCGFATSQSAYEEAFNELFSCLDELDKRLATQRFLVGSRFTEADIRLFTTLIRFDAVYVGHFKCNLKAIREYQHLAGYVREIFQLPGVSGTVNFNHIKKHYYTSHPTLNPARIVPVGPDLSWLYVPHDRGSLPAATQLPSQSA